MNTSCSIRQKNEDRIHNTKLLECHLAIHPVSIKFCKYSLLIMAQKYELALMILSISVLLFSIISETSSLRSCPFNCILSFVQQNHIYMTSTIFFIFEGIVQNILPYKRTDIALKLSTHFFVSNKKSCHSESGRDSVNFFFI